MLFWGLYFDFLSEADYHLIKILNFSFNNEITIF